MKNWKKALAYYAFLLASNNAYATWQGSWVFGISENYIDRRGEVDIGTLYTMGAPFFPLKTESNQRYSDIGWGGGILGGYQINSKGWTWGVEISVDWLDVASQRVFVYPDLLPNNFTLFSWRAQVEYHRDEPIVALSGRMAYEMAPYFIPYLRLGVEGGDESLDVEIMAGSNFFASGATLHTSRWVWHYLLGVGFEVPLGCSPLTIRAEYNYHSRARPLSAIGRIEDGIVNPVFTAQMSPITNSGKVSLVWNFF